MSATSTTTVSTTNGSAADTQTRILDAAEFLFVEHGYAATSLRAIATEAGVNLAATNYHFGSKLGLFGAVFHRRVKPINEARLSNLEALRESERPLTVRILLEAFFSPLRQGIRDPIMPALMGRIYAEPRTLTEPILTNEFQHVAMAFQAALSEILPDIPLEILRWRFHFMIGSMIQLLQFHAPLGTESTIEKFAEGIPHLINFVESGLQEPYQEQRHD